MLLSSRLPPPSRDTLGETSAGGSPIPKLPLKQLGGGEDGRLKVRRVTPAKYPSRYKPSWENNETRAL